MITDNCEEVIENFVDLSLSGRVEPSEVLPILQIAELKGIFNELRLLRIILEERKEWKLKF